MVTYETQETLSHVLTQEGVQIAREGSHEARVWNALPIKGEGKPVTIKELQQLVGSESAKVGQGAAFKNKWIGKEGDGFVKTVSHPVSGICWLLTSTPGWQYYGRHERSDAKSRLYRDITRGRRCS